MSRPFEPGNMPSLEYNGVFLNANVPWHELIYDLNKVHCTKKQIAEYIECSILIVDELLKCNYSHLSFRAGARLVTLHVRYFPELFV